MEEAKVNEKEEYARTGEEHNQFEGDTPNPSGPNTLRILYNNCNGLEINELVKSKLKAIQVKKKKKHLSYGTEKNKVGGLVGALDQVGANIGCFSETQSKWESATIRGIVSKMFKRKDAYSTLTCSSSTTWSASYVKPGGTMLSVDGNWSSRISKRGQDSHGMGRWSYVTLNGRDNTKLTVICAYRCCKSQNIKTVGATTSFAQQYKILRRNKIKKPSPREAFIKHMKAFINSCLEQSHEIILCLDANEEWEEKNSRIKDMATTLGLHDIVGERYVKPPGTYRRQDKTNRIDFFLGTEGVTQSVTAHGMAPKSFGNSLGDHRAMFLDIDVAKLLNLGIHDNCSPTSRKLKSSDIKGSKKYLEALVEGFTEHNVFKRMEGLKDELKKTDKITKYQKKVYDGIDQDVHRICIKAEKDIRKCVNGKFAWSPKLDAAHINLKYWKQRVQNLGDSSETEKLLLYSEEMEIKDDMELERFELEKNVVDSKKKLKQIQASDVEYRVQHLLELAENYAATNNLSHEVAIRELLMHEELRDTYKQIKGKLKGAMSQQLYEIWVKCALPEGKKVIDQCDELEEHLLHRNAECLMKAKNTPFAEGTSSVHLGKYGTSDFATRVLNGQELHEVSSENIAMRTYLEALAYKDPTVPDSVDVNLNLDDYKYFWKKNERQQ